MSSKQRKKFAPSRSKTRHTKGKRPNAAPAKALVNKAEHVRKQSLKPGRASGEPSGPTTQQSNGLTPEVLRTATESLAPSIPAATQALAFWSPVAVLLRQQTLLASMALNVIQTQRLWTQAFTRLATM